MSCFVANNFLLLFAVRVWKSLWLIMSVIINDYKIQALPSLIFILNEMAVWKVESQY